MSERVVLGRRTVLGMLASAFVAACTSSSEGTAAGSSTPTTSGPAGAAVDLSAASEAADAPRPAADYERWAAQNGGTLLGSWAESTGDSGTVDANIAIDPEARRATGTLSFTGRFLGGEPPPPTSYEVDLDTYAADTDAVDVHSPQLGVVELELEGFGRLRLTCTEIPSHDDVARLVVDLGSGTGSYVATATDGTTRQGALAWSNGGSRPPAPAPGTASDAQAFVRGDYACSLLTAEEVDAAFGSTGASLVSNGGRANYAPGIDVSNCLARASDSGLIAQYGVYRAADPDRAHEFFALNQSGVEPVAGLGDEAQLLTSVGDLFVRVGNEVLDLQVVDASATPRSAVELRAVQQAIATSIAARLGRG